MITGIAGWAILAIVILAVVAIVFVIAKAMGVAIPPWVITIAWIVFAAVVGIAAINIVVSML